jgi:hypothetical protein
MDPEDPAVAQKIVSEYAALLEAHAVQDVYPAPVDALPYPKLVIKSAIRTSVGALVATGQMTDELRDFLEVAYVSLADYVEADLVRLMTEYRGAAADLAEGTRVAKDKVATPAWKMLSGSSSLAGEIAKAIAEDTEMLRREFRAFYQRETRESGSRGSAES